MALSDTDDAPPYDDARCQRFLGALYLEYERWPRLTLGISPRSLRTIPGFASCLTTAEADAFVSRKKQTQEAVEFYCGGDASRDASIDLRDPCAREHAGHQQDVLWNKMKWPQKLRVAFLKYL